MKSAGNLLKYILVLFFLIPAYSFTSQPTVKKGNLKVIVNKMRNSAGQIGFSLYNSDKGFPNHPENAISNVFVKNNGTSVEYTFTNIVMGTYAIAVFHDENSDKKINTNWLGIPKEGVGVSNNAKGSFGPPKFDDAKFDFNKPEQTITISLNYL
ncbi:MAG TPA: DUF2141 domain-containing protein [Bacteroidia bacterium]|jgi:uncharacterized protein (DUF2141 family)|nr:DUF2141 domain-containing protein [Bacteroidia bacterium]